VGILEDVVRQLVLDLELAHDGVSGGGVQGGCWRGDPTSEWYILGGACATGERRRYGCAPIFRNRRPRLRRRRRRPAVPP
jgi:hypothetical protein